MLYLTFDDRVTPASLGVGRICSGGDEHALADRGERIAQFVCQGCQELIFAAVGRPKSILVFLVAGDIREPDGNGAL